MPQLPTKQLHEQILDGRWAGSTPRLPQVLSFLDICDASAAAHADQTADAT